MPPLTESTSLYRHATWLEIDLSRILNNLDLLKRQSPYAHHTMAIIKANAYGHGLISVAAKLSNAVDYFGVSSLKEALELKEHHIETPIFILGRLFGHEIQAALMKGITLSVSSFEECLEISQFAEGLLDRNVSVHAKVDTGMGRMGIPYDQAFFEISRIKELSGIELEGIYTHFPTAERDDGFRDQQLENFFLLIQRLYERGITFRYRHASNSAGMLKAHHPVLNLCRPGLMLYGIYPDDSLKNGIEVLPCLKWKSRIILVKRLKAGESVGYGRDFVAQRPTNIAVLSVGYSHGYPFTASNKAYVLFRGKRYPIAGRVSMDYLTVNLGDAEAQAGDEITLLGEEQSTCIHAEDLARWAGTIPYEIITRILPGLPRIYR